MIIVIMIPIMLIIIPFTLIKRVRYIQLNKKKKIVAGVLLKVPYL